MSNIDSSNDVIDSRDIIERIEELRTEKDDWNENEDNQTSWDEEYPDDSAELNKLEELASECEGVTDWEHGESLIRSSYFSDYVQELLEDCGTIPRDLPSFVVIDWNETAENIAQDYMLVTYDSVDFYIRNC